MYEDRSQWDQEGGVMTFAEWKKKSRVFGMFRDRADNYGIGLQECCQAAYKAGERQGRKDAEEMARRAIELREMLNRRVA